jgi:hypothetical protein
LPQHPEPDLFTFYGFHEPLLVLTNRPLILMVISGFSG